MFLIWFISFHLLCNYIIEKKKKHKKRLKDHEQVKNFFKSKLETSEPIIITAPVYSVSAAG